VRRTQSWSGGAGLAPFLSRYYGSVAGFCPRLKSQSHSNWLYSIVDLSLSALQPLRGVNDSQETIYPGRVYPNDSADFAFDGRAEGGEKPLIGG
jgi:hypothetical protein